MINILLVGASGKMGKAVYSKTEDNENYNITAGIDIIDSGSSFPIYKSFSDIPADVNENIDVIIDFSNPAVFNDLLDYIIENKKPAVICTTGLKEEQIIKLKSAAYEVPIFFSANMSLGVNLVCELSRKAAKALGDDFDIEIIEMHHNQKLDAPSGTAIMIADAITDELDDTIKYEYDRHSKREKRTTKEIGISSVRGGNIVGEHQVIFAGNDEIVTISHSARSKTLFAAGALNAAKMIAGKKNGLYSMKEMIDG